MLKIIGSCKEVTRIASKGIDSKLSLVESVSLRIHALMCRACRGYNHEIKQITKIAREKQLEISRKLSEDQKQRIINAVEKQIAENE